MRSQIGTWLLVTAVTGFVGTIGCSPAGRLTAYDPVTMDPVRLDRDHPPTVTDRRRFG